MIKVHKKFIILVAIFVLLTAASFSVWYFFFNKEKNIEQVEEVKKRILSDEEKLMILDSLAKREKVELTAEEKKDVIENLAKREKQVLSEEEKAKILESLNKRN